jgi:hypothetical protein
MKRLGMGLVILIALGSLRAFASFHLEQPGNKVSAAEAMKVGTKGGEIYRCRKVKVGPSLNPVAAIGSKYTFHSAVGKGVENPADLLADGKKLYRCEAIEVDEISARARKKADADE